MNKNESLSLLKDLNTVIRGSNSIIKAIDLEKNINVEKGIKACMLNSITLAKTIKILLDDIVVANPSSSSMPDFGEGGKIFNDIFSGGK